MRSRANPAYRCSRSRHSCSCSIAVLSKFRVERGNGRLRVDAYSDPSSGSTKNLQFHADDHECIVILRRVVAVTKNVDPHSRYALTLERFSLPWHFSLVGQGSMKMIVTDLLENIERIGAASRDLILSLR